MCFSFKIKPDSYYKFYIFYGIMLTLLITFFILSILNYKTSKNLEYSTENDPDIDLTGIISFQFSSSIKSLEYYPGKSNLGSTGEINLDCYKGSCIYEYEEKCIKQRCEGIGEDEKCESYIDTCTYSMTELFLSCSQQCRKTNSDSCGYSYCTHYSNVHFKESKCERIYNDKYNDKKSCYADNLILNWKGLFYEKNNANIYGQYSYLNNAIKADELCPDDKKMCGILDEFGNKLCYPKDENCPINFITLNISEMNYTNYNTAVVGNKTFYYTNESTETGIIFGGLFVDSDLLIRYVDKECEILDIGNISDLIKNNPYKLYQNVLNFDPYKDTNIDQKGKSYLKWCIPGNRRIRDIDKIKALKIIYDNNVTYNKDVIKTIKSTYYTPITLAYIGSIITFFTSIIFLSAFLYMNNICHCNCGNCNDLCLLIITTIFYLIGLVLITLSTIFSQYNNSSLFSAEKSNDIVLLITFNIFIIILDIMIILIYISIIILLCKNKSSDIDNIVKTPLNSDFIQMPELNQKEIINN